MKIPLETWTSKWIQLMILLMFFTLISHIGNSGRAWFIFTPLWKTEFCLNERLSHEIQVYTQQKTKNVLTCQAIRNSPIWNSYSSFITFLPNQLSNHFISSMSQLWDCNTHMSSSWNVSSPINFSDTRVPAPNCTSPPVLLEPYQFFLFSHFSQYEISLQ